MESKQDFNLMLVHTSELDHRVHVDRLSSKQIPNILEKDQQLFTRLLDSLDDETLLIATADHGLIETGHGGISQNEITSFVFAYSKSGLLRSNPSVQKLFRPEVDKKVVENFDITPTLSLLLNKSPPFNTIGDLLLDILPLPKELKAHASSQSPESQKLPLPLILSLLEAKLQVLLQKKALTENLFSLDKEHKDLHQNIEKAILKAKNIISRIMGKKGVKRQAGAREKEYYDNYEEIMKNVRQLFDEVETHFQLLKMYTSNRAILIDGFSSVIIFVGLMAMAVGLIIDLELLAIGEGAKPGLGPRQEGLLLLGLGFLGATFALISGASIFSGILLTFGLGFFFVLPIIESVSTEQGVFAKVIKFLEFCKQAVSNQKKPLVLLLTLFVFKIIENNNCLMDDIPFQTMFCLKILISYIGIGFTSLVSDIFRKTWKQTFKNFLTRIWFNLSEVAVYLIMSFGDKAFLERVKGILDDGVYGFFNEHGYLVGTEIPGMILTCLVLYFLSFQCPVTLRTRGLFMTQMILALGSVRHLETSHFIAREVIASLVLLLTVFSFFYYFKSNKHLPNSKYHKFALIICTLLPLIVMIGGQFASYQILLLALAIRIRFKETKSVTPSFIIEALWLTRMGVYGSGTRLQLNQLCLNCGTLFYNDYHFMSWLPVMLHTVYMVLIGRFLELTLILKEYDRGKAHRNITMRGKKSHQELVQIELFHKKNTSKAIMSFFNGASVLHIGDLLGMALIFARGTEGFVTYQATSSYVYQIQFFIATSVVKFLFIMIK